MICNQCNVKNFCKYYQLVITTFDVELTINKCSFKNIDNDSSLEESADSILKVNQNIALYAGSARPDLKELEKQVNNIEDKPSPIKVSCPTCEGTTYDDDIDFCHKCSKTICSNCGTSSDGKKYCETCWKEN